jgi:ArsR family transcriptional regulator
VPRQDGRFVIYSAEFDTMNGLIGFLTENCCGGVPCGPTLTGCKP